MHCVGKKPFKYVRFCLCIMMCAVSVCEDSLVCYCMSVTIARVLCSNKYFAYAIIFTFFLFLFVNHFVYAIFVIFFYSFLSFHLLLACLHFGNDFLALEDSSRPFLLLGCTFFRISHLYFYNFATRVLLIIFCWRCCCCCCCHSNFWKMLEMIVFDGCKSRDGFHCFISVAVANLRFVWILVAFC